jgi:hypothetical protein
LTFVIDEAVNPPNGDGSINNVTASGLQYDINGGTLINVGNWTDNSLITLGGMTG